MSNSQERSFGAKLARLFQQEDLNFLVTNRIPRRFANRFMGWFSRIEWKPIAWASMTLWRTFARDLDLSDAKKQKFKSLHDCFVRELVPDARKVDKAPGILTSPCDAIVGTHGRIQDTTLFQAKGYPYTLEELLIDPELVDKHRNGQWITLRLKSTMYHRFHAPCDGEIKKVHWVPGDTWNVNPIALKRVDKLFCQNERAVLPFETQDSKRAITLVPVAAILVGSLVLHGLQEVLDLRYQGPEKLGCSLEFIKGEELGYFQHGSTIIMFVSGDFHFCDGIREGAEIRMGQRLLQMTEEKNMKQPAEAANSVNGGENDG